MVRSRYLVGDAVLSTTEHKMNNWTTVMVWWICIYWIMDTMGDFGVFTKLNYFTTRTSRDLVL